MECKNGLKLLLVLGLEQVFHGALWQSRERVIVRSKNSVIPFAFKSLGEARSLDGCNQSLELSAIFEGRHYIFGLGCCGC